MAVAETTQATPAAQLAREAPTSLAISLQDKQLLRGLRAVAVDPATAIAVSVERAEAFFLLFRSPLHSTQEES